MGLDIRVPIGLLFTIFGLVLTVFGFLSNREIYRASLGLNINILWGLVLLAFGVLMLVYGRISGSPAEAAKASDSMKAAVGEFKDR